MRIVGRARELARLESVLRAAGNGRGRAVEIAGEPGVGKTALIAGLGARAEGWQVLTGRGTEFEADVPFSIFADALDEAVAALGPERVARLSGGRLGELAAMLPSIAAPRPSLDGERHRLHYAVRALLAGMADARPLLLVLDDVHWADPASLELIAHLVRRPPPCTLIVLAYRTALRPRALRGEAITLAPLTREEADELLRGVPDADALYERSGGIPLYLEALLKGSGPLTFVADELHALSGTARRLAQGAAVAGEPFAPELAAAAAELDDPLDALDELLAADLVRPGDAPRRFRFRHPVVRQGVYESAGAGWRLGAHARVEAVLARQGAAASRRAHHLEHCAQPGDRQAVEVLAAAAAGAAPRAPAAAARWWAAALRLLPADAPNDERLELLVPRATALGAAGELAESRDALYEALALVPQPEVKGHVVAFIAMIEQLLGRHDEAHALLTATLADQPESAALRIELAKGRYFAADWRGMRRHAAEALALARKRDDAPLIAAAAGILALAEYHLPDVAAARPLLDEAALRLDALTDDQLAGRLDAALFVGWAEQCLARWGDVHRHYERALAVARATGQFHLRIPMTIGRAIAHLWQGNLAAAAELADDVIEVARVSGHDQWIAWTLTTRCWIATLAGDLELALDAGREAHAIIRRLPRSHWGALTACYLAEAHLEAGDHDAARRLLVPELQFVERAFQTRWYEVLTRAELAAGRFCDADRHAAHAEMAACGLGLPARSSEALRARAAVLLAAGDTAGAARAASLSAREAQAAGNWLDTARAQLLAGQALAAGGHVQPAAAALQTARDAFAECGARRFGDQAARELRRLGRRVARQGRRRRRPERGVGALTDREREIAELLARGHTNRRIAAHLHLSTKTVETHVAHIFAKLDVRSRAAVAATIART
ncbi:MAG TPA: AAA family ATPase [Solirubrobacter sp.]|nr:AAA family ATPase [Solirubrobacter sp.]